MGVFEDLFNKAIDIYNVNPYIFLILYLVSVPIYYYGHVAMIKSGYRYYKDKKKTLKTFGVTEFLKDKGFIRGLIINRSAWVMPYIYVMVAGRNLPIWVYLLIIAWLALTSFLVVRKSRQKVVTDLIDCDLEKKSNQ